MPSEIKINRTTYQINRIHAGSESVSSLLQKRIMQELETQKALTVDEAVMYNNRGRSIRSEEAN